MQDMIAKIVEMDEKARELTAQAQREKATSEQDIVKAKEKIYNDFIERARQRIKINEKTERKIAQDRLENTALAQEECLQAMEALYQQNGDRWIEEIVKQVLR
ncbi:MAG TPA: hypothetical protein IAD32_04485 [Candidatus Scatavimonas merdigallinarum]|uniref:Uncharacterized protein n=1 Tax=Candidatus Scatavimonas merdigallinarum TaxID=2840914 RepID=A0A9D1CU92_9FIRM|nr:hypothetical protein [Candidatus Scatavimonas merdigallinarum]